VRIVGGRFRGSRLASPGDRAIRPTSDRVREAVFNIILHGSDNFEIAGARVLDLFAGTGALGLEALSRGAGHALFVETSAAARGLIRANAEQLDLMGEARIFRRDACRLGEAGRIAPFDLVFVDPPYGRGLGEQALESAHAGNWIADNALVVIEEATASAFARPDGFILLDERQYGETVVRFLRLSG